VIVIKTWIFSAHDAFLE